MAGFQAGMAISPHTYEKKSAPMHVVVRPVSLAGRVILCDLIIIGEKSPD